MSGIAGGYPKSVSAQLEVPEEAHYVHKVQVLEYIALASCRLKTHMCCVQDLQLGARIMD